MKEGEIRVPLDSGSITAIAAEPDGPARGTLLYAPGAGSKVHDPFGRYLCRELADAGMRAVRFQFAYQEAGRRTPDRNDRLEEVWRAVIAAFEDPHLVVAGRSMGGRIGSQVVAQGERASRVALFAYPLHPPGKPDNTRDSHLPLIEPPVFFCSGTKDAFASPEELEAVCGAMPAASLHLLEGADHGFNVRKASGRTREDVHREALEALGGWLEGLA